MKTPERDRDSKETKGVVGGSHDLRLVEKGEGFLSPSIKLQVIHLTRHLI